MKIKRKVQKNLPQLIEWVWDNNRKAKNFKCKEGNEIKHIIYANPTGRLNLDSERYYDKNDLFTVEVEEEITEDTVFEEILLIVNNGLGIEVYSNYSINDVLSNNEGYYEETVMLILKPDPEVIWTREKGLVE